jgi:hypothetical protein
LHRPFDYFRLLTFEDALAGRESSQPRASVASADDPLIVRRSGCPLEL